jgi:hypothetical protein
MKGDVYTDADCAIVAHEMIDAGDLDDSIAQRISEGYLDEFVKKRAIAICFLRGIPLD